MPEELKPCPFCGKSVKLEKDEGTNHLIRCKCGVYMFENMEWDVSEPELLIKAWNTRFDD